MPTKLPEPTPELLKEICDNITAGMLRVDAAVCAGVERDAFVEMMHRGERGEERFAGFRRQILKTDMESRRRLVAKVSLAATDDPKYAAWMLVHRHGWGNKDAGEEPRPLLPVASAEDAKALAKRITARYPLLPWESADQFEELLAGLLTEHAPQGPTEEHLVEELAGILLRKGRHRLAEIAAHRRALKETLGKNSRTVNAALAHLGETEPEEKVVNALCATEDETASDLAALKEEQSEVSQAIELLDSTDKEPYQAALAALGDKKDWWTQALARRPGPYDDELRTYKADAKGLRLFLEGEVLPWYGKRSLELENRPLIREQAFGEALSPAGLEVLRRIEANLDRKLEHTLETLLRLQELRRAKTG
jgi:hypothetical protein